jgi:hypothetical protein
MEPSSIPIIDYVALIQLDKHLFKSRASRINLQALPVDSVVSSVYPPETNAAFPLKGVDFKSFAFPSGLRLPSEPMTTFTPTYHSFVLTLADGTRVYG